MYLVFEEIKSLLRTALAKRTLLKSTSIKLAEVFKNGNNNKKKSSTSQGAAFTQYHHSNQSTRTGRRNAERPTENGQGLEIKEQSRVVHSVPLFINLRFKNAYVHFERGTKRNEVLEKARKCRLTCGDHGFTSHTPVYANRNILN